MCPSTSSARGEWQPAIRRTRREKDRHDSLGDVEQRHRNRVFPAENAVDIGRAEVPGAVLTQIDPPSQLTGDVARRGRAEQIGGEQRQSSVQRRPRLRRNLIVSGAHVNSHASRKPLRKQRVYERGSAYGL